MNKKKFTIIIVAFLLFAAGIIAVTQEAEFFIDLPETEEFDFEKIAEFYEDDEYEYVPPYSGYIYARVIPEWVQPRRWFRSNAGGLAIEEMQSRLSAIRYEYALAVDYVQREDLPDELLSFYNDDEHYIEVRLFYENGIQTRTQWIFRDLQARQKLVAVFAEFEESARFIECYDDSGLISLEYIYHDDGRKNRIDYSYNNTVLSTSIVYDWKENDDIEDYVIAYIDSFRYNRSGFLRAVERRYYQDGKVSFSNEPIRLSLPSTIKGAIEDKAFLGARYNSLPDFFGVVDLYKDARMVYRTDDRNKIISQTLYDDEDEVIWVITNTWKDDRIVASVKKEGDIEMAAYYEYDKDGNIVKERNLKNGVLERVVHIEGSREIEELYLDDVMVLRAVWEDGKKISETRITNN